MSKLGNYFSETREELKQVTWPTRRTTALFTALVIAISIALAAYLGFFDYLFSAILKNIF